MFVSCILRVFTNICLTNAVHHRKKEKYDLHNDDGCVAYTEMTHLRTSYMGKFAETTNVNYRLSFADQGKTNFRFPYIYTLKRQHIHI